jgi:competence protein ComEC
VLPLIGLGMAVIACSLRWGRAVGAALILGGCVLWTMTTRPDLLISGDGRLVGLMGEEGRWLSREAGAGFPADSWLDNDGDGALQAVAAARPVPQDGPELRVLRGKTGLPEALSDCATQRLWLVTPVTVEGDTGLCRVFDQTALRRSGAVAVYLDAEPSPRFVHATDVQGLRPWTRAWLMDDQ